VCRDLQRLSGFYLAAYLIDAYGVSVGKTSHKDLYVVTPGDWGKGRRVVKYSRKG